ncbi:unnamed protein product [Gadus morhua 'NCC']
MHALKKGSYFARDASYSHNYNGNASTVRSMFVSRVLVGHHNRGKAGYVRPPSKDGGDTLFYDSCVNDILSPSIFVVFDRPQIQGKAREGVGLRRLVDPISNRRAGGETHARAQGHARAQCHARARCQAHNQAHAQCHARAQCHACAPCHPLAQCHTRAQCHSSVQCHALAKVNGHGLAEGHDHAQDRARAPLLPSATPMPSTTHVPSATPVSIATTLPRAWSVHRLTPTPVYNPAYVKPTVLCPPDFQTSIPAPRS